MKNQVIFSSEKLRFICFGPQHSPTIVTKIEENWVHGRAEAEWGGIWRTSPFRRIAIPRSISDLCLGSNFRQPRWSQVDGQRVDGQGTQ